MRLQEGLLLTLAILARSSVSFASVEHVVYLDEDSYVEHSINDVFSAASRSAPPYIEQITSFPEHGVVSKAWNSNYSLIYRPASNFCGKDSTEYIVKNGFPLTIIKDPPLELGPLKGMNSQGKIANII